LTPDKSGRLAWYFLNERLGITNEGGILETEVFYSHTLAFTAISRDWLHVPAPSYFQMIKFFISANNVKFQKRLIYMIFNGLTLFWI
jgi:hypothetical protein